MQVNKSFNVGVIEENLVPRTGIIAQINKLKDFKCSESHFSPEDEQFFNDLDVVFYSARGINPKNIQHIININTRWPRLNLVLLSPGITKREQLKLLNLGIKGLIAEELTKQSLRECLKCVINKGLYYPKDIIISLIKSSKKPSDGYMIKAAFSEFRLNLLRLLANGNSTQEISKKVFRANRTIEWHKKEMMNLIGVSSTIQLILFAVEYGVIESPFALSKTTTTDTNTSITLSL